MPTRPPPPPLPLSVSYIHPSPTPSIRSRSLARWLAGWLASWLPSLLVLVPCLNYNGGGSVAEDSGGGTWAAPTSLYPPVVSEAVPNVREGFGRPSLSRVLYVQPPPGSPINHASGGEAGRLWIRDDLVGLSGKGQRHRSRHTNSGGGAMVCFRLNVEGGSELG